MLIGYPGMDKLVVGGGGVHRAKLHVHGIASRSGGSKTTPSAIEKAAHLIRALSTAELPDGASADFPLSGKLTVTAVTGGQGYSVTPDLCTLNVDVRTTPAFDSDAATRLLEQLTSRVDDAWPGTRPTLIQVDTRWPAYALANDSALRAAILGAAASAGVEVEPKIAGPATSATTLPDSASLPPPASVPPTPACTAPTNASASTPSPPSKPSTTTQPSPCSPRDARDQDEHHHHHHHRMGFARAAPRGRVGGGGQARSRRNHR